MLTLPLYTPADVPDASHRVLAPGGYETWRFDAESATGDVRLVAALGAGSPLDAAYLRRYLQYRRRPTRRPPPVPPDFPFAHFAVYEGERPVARFTTRAAPEEFTASPHEPAVNVAGNEFVRERDGSLALRLRGLPMNEASGGPGGGACLSAQLTFHPLLRHAPYEVDLAGTRPGVDVHRWVIAAPACEVTGSIVFTPANGDGSRAGVREIAFRGRGYHDHRYGTAPPAATLRRWASGRVFLGGTTYVFHAARPLEREAAERVRLVRCGPEGIHEVERGPTRVAWNNGGPLGLPYPAELAGDGGLRLTAPKVIDSDRCRRRLLYHAEAPGGGEKGTAWCEVGVPPCNASLVRGWVARGVNTNRSSLPRHRGY